MKTKIILVENDEIWRFIYKRQLRNTTDVIIIGEFERAEEALQQIPQLCPDVAIVDISLPGMSGLEFADKMQEYLAVKIILITSHQKEYISSKNQCGHTVLDKSDHKGILEKIKCAVGT